MKAGRLWYRVSSITPCYDSLWRDFSCLVNGRYWHTPEVEPKSYWLAFWHYFLKFEKTECLLLEIESRPLLDNCMVTY